MEKWERRRPIDTVSGNDDLRATAEGGFLQFWRKKALYFAILVLSNTEMTDFSIFWKMGTEGPALRCSYLCAYSP